MNRATEIHNILKILVDECQDFPKTWTKVMIEDFVLEEIHKAEILINEAIEKYPE